MKFLKIAVTLLLALAANLQAASDKELRDFVKRSFERNPNFTFDRMTVDSRVAVKNLAGWEKVEFTITAAPKGQMKTISQKNTLYVTGNGKTAFFAASIEDTGAKRAGDKEFEAEARKTLAGNPSVTLNSVKVAKRVKLQNPVNFEAVFMELDLTVKSADNKTRQVSSSDVWFASGGVIVKEIFYLADASPLKDAIKGDITPDHYRADHLIAGDAKAKYKIIVFSDPLCPGCRATLPRLIKAADANPKEIAIYYYNLPTHAVSPTLMKAVIASALAGDKDAERNIYLQNFAARTGDDEEALKIFNNAFDKSLKMSDLDDPMVKEHFDFDDKASREIAVNSTPSVFINGKYDPSRAEMEKILSRLGQK
ncbi:MAG: thioredoxin domain-containing protein [Helicobacteraceae bacterium]|jgi:protein-disulfide isomerase|nr:thioredoxin domain-containing protein [Helicobacteraceae bacterium]